MTEKNYRDAIREACVGLGVHRVEFSRTRVRLAKIYMRIELLEKELANEGYAVSRSDEEAAEKKTKSSDGIDPRVTELDRLYDKALAHERALGLTADSVRKINEAAFAPKTQEDALSKALRVIGGGSE